ncbi:hypothetical protein HAHE_40980 [Haloferula helveola]|uniref:SnoaL-like domain-containing protein n=2 Tax=Haloferula helveola TaxID=490095 RepID=A0ABM7RQ19_9BACT|nr:hypothetical protein HAHE_40980 [Haloferula helveola]
MVVAIAAAAVAFLLWWFSATQVLKRRVSSLIDTAVVPASMSDIGRGARGPNVAEFVAGSLEIDSPPSLAQDLGPDLNRDTVSALYSAVAKYCRSITVNDLKIQSVDVDGETATVRFSADAVVDLPDRRPVDGIVDVDSRWRKTDGKWLLERFAWTESPRSAP